MAQIVQRTFQSAEAILNKKIVADKKNAFALQIIWEPWIKLWIYWTVYPKAQQTSSLKVSIFLIMKFYFPLHSVYLDKLIERKSKHQKEF